MEDVGAADQPGPPPTLNDGSERAFKDDHPPVPCLRRARVEPEGPGLPVEIGPGQGPELDEVADVGVVEAV
jgi:hypothetical protein